MAASFLKGFLSASTNGKGLAVSQTSGARTTLHQAVSGTAAYDEIYLFANPQNGVGGNLYLRWGGTNPSDLKVITLPGMGADILIIPGYILNNSLVVDAYTDPGILINITGWVHTLQFS